MDNKKGLTLIEVILTIAIIGILSIPIFTIFNSGLNNIVKAGNRTESVVETKEKIDDIIYGRFNSDEEIPYEVTLDIKDRDNNLIYNDSIDGKKIIVSTKDKYMNDITIETFVPNEK